MTQGTARGDTLFGDVSGGGARDIAIAGGGLHGTGMDPQVLWTRAHRARGADHTTVDTYCMIGDATTTTLCSFRS